MAQLDLARVDRPVTLDDLALVDVEGDGVQIADADYAEQPEGKRPFTAILERDDPPPAHQEQVGWADRLPIDGSTQIDPGRYYIFLTLEVTGPAAFDDVELAWTDEDGTSGSTPWLRRQEFERRCG